MRWLALALLAGPAVAQDAVDPAFCADLALALPVLDVFTLDLDKTVEVGTTRVDGDRCVYSDIVITSDYNDESSVGMAFDGLLLPREHIERLAISGLGLDAILTGAYPRAVDLRIEGYYWAADPADEFYNFAEVVMARFDAWDITLRAEFDTDARQLVLHELTYHLQNDWVVSTSATIRNIDATDLNTVIETGPAADIPALRLEVSGTGIFEKGVLGTLASSALIMFMTDEMFEGLVSDARQSILDAPPALMNAQSREEVFHLLDDLPHPTGALSVDIQAESGLSVARFAPLMAMGPPDSAEAFWPMLQGVSFDVDYRPE